jgi:hypothetical protein
MAKDHALTQLEGRMQLPEFISKALAFFQKAEANLTAEQELAKARSRIVELEASADTVDGLKARILELETAATASAATLKERDTEIATLKASVETEKGKTTDTLSGMGVRPDTIPGAGAPAAGADTGKSLVDQMNAIKDPSARTAFYRKNREGLLAASRAERVQPK